MTVSVAAMATDSPIPQAAISPISSTTSTTRTDGDRSRNSRRYPTEPSATAAAAKVPATMTSHPATWPIVFESKPVRT